MSFCSAMALRTLSMRFSRRTPVWTRSTSTREWFCLSAVMCTNVPQYTGI